MFHPKNDVVMKERMLTKNGMVFVDTVTKNFMPCLKVTQSKLKDDGSYHYESIYLNQEEMLRLHEMIERAEADMQQMRDAWLKEASERGIPLATHQMWSEDDDQKLSMAYDQGKPTEKIAKLLERSERAIWYRLQHLGKITSVPPQFLVPLKA